LGGWGAAPVPLFFFVLLSLVESRGGCLECSYVTRAWFFENEGEASAVFDKLASRSDIVEVRLARWRGYYVVCADCSATAAEEALEGARPVRVLEGYWPIPAELDVKRVRATYDTWRVPDLEESERGLAAVMGLGAARGGVLVQVYSYEDFRLLEEPGDVYVYAWLSERVAPEVEGSFRYSEVFVDSPGRYYMSRVASYCLRLKYFRRCSGGLWLGVFRVWRFLKGVEALKPLEVIKSRGGEFCSAYTCGDGTYVCCCVDEDVSREVVSGLWGFRAVECWEGFEAVKTFLRLARQCREVKS